MAFEHVVKLTRWLVIAICSAGLQACAAATSTTTIAPPATVPRVAAAAPASAAPIVQTHPIAHFGAWLDASEATAAVTTFITVQAGCKDDVALAESRVQTHRDARQIVWFANMFTLVDGGYALRPDYADCWQELRLEIANEWPRTLAVWLLDEPPDVAYGARGSAQYDPNVYNDLINQACAFMHADIPTLKVGLNYGHLPDGLFVPPCLDVVGLEAYDADWSTKLARLKQLTPAPIWLLPRAFTDNGDATDAEAAQRLQAQYAYAQADPRIVALLPFLWCCDDTTTGNKSFYTISGPMLPLARASFEAIGTAIRGGRP